MEYILQLENEYNDIYYDLLKDDILNNFKSDIFIVYDKNSGINNDLIQCLLNDIYNYSDYDLHYYYRNNIVALIIDTIKKYKRINIKQALKIKNAINKQDKNAFIIGSLQAIYNKRYEMTVLRGYCQGDYAYMYYAIDEIKYDFIQYIEAVIFNTGYGIMIHEGDDIPTKADDIHGYCDYIPSITGDIKQDIATHTGINKDDIKLWIIKNSYKVTHYEYEVL